MEFQRKKYLDSLIARKHNGMIKIVTGIRRCGKSYLLFNIFYRHLISIGVPEDHIIRIALDDLENESLCEYHALYNRIKSLISDSGMYYLLLDEIQFVPQFEKVLNSLLHIGNIDTYVTGSNSKFLSSDIVTEFRGRGDEIRLHPISFAEFAEAKEGSFDDLWNEYFRYGGLPQAVNISQPNMKAEYLKNLFEKVYISDVLEHHRINNISDFSEILDFLASSTGSYVNPTKLEKTFKTVKHSTISHTTISQYIEYLKDAFLISKAQRYDIKGKKYINANCKYYFEDPGLRNARLDFRQTEENHLMENIIYNELLFRGYNVDIGIVENFERNEKKEVVRKQFEVDFVANSGDRRCYIQSAFSMFDEQKREQEKKSLKNIPDSFKKIIIVRENTVSGYDENGFFIMGLKDFLTNPASLDF